MMLEVLLAGRGGTRLVNLAHVVDIKPLPDGSEIRLDNGDVLKVMDTFTVIADRLVPQERPR